MHSGHADFGQAGYPQQFPYGQPLSSLPSSHDMGKQVAAGQSAMFTGSGGMPSAAQQHHQAAMTVPTSVQQTQQMPRANLTAYYQTPMRQSRPMTGMTRAMGPVVNQLAQHPTAQYSLNVVPQQTFIHNTGIQPIQINPYMFQQRPMATQYPHVMPHGQPQMQYVNQWNNFPNQPPSNSNNFFQTHGMYNNGIPPMSQHQQMPQQPVQPHVERKKKILTITDPNTGQDIMGNMNSKPPMIEKETDNADSNIYAQFATQVIVAASEKNETLSKSTPIEFNRLVEPDNISPDMTQVRNMSELQLADLSEMEAQEKSAEVDSLEDLADTESLIDVVSCNESDVAWTYDKDTDEGTIEREYDSAAKSVTEDVQISHYDSEIIQQPSSDEPVAADEVDSPLTLSVSDLVIERQEQVSDEEIQLAEEVKPTVLSSNSEIPSVPIASNVIPKALQTTFGLNDKVQEPEDASSKQADKSGDARKNKAKKKKEINKRGESKEGGEMDAYLDSEKEVAPQPSAPLPTMSVPTPTVERMTSPVPNFDSEALDNIPLPADPFPVINFQQNDTSPSEPPSEESSISPGVENDDKENVDETSKMVLKYSYKEDQWSPLNPEGKKQYDRDFLIQLQSQPMSLCKPTNLPNLDVIKDKFHIQRLNEVNRALPVVPQMRVDTFLPVYARASTPRMSHPAINRRSQPRDSKPKKIISFSNSLGQQIKLHESENAWKPLAKQDTQSDIGSSESDLEKLKRSVQGVLNKLTPQKFETLLQQIKSFNIDTEEKLKIVIDLTFEKAIDEPNFSVPYANLCKHLALIKVPLLGQQGHVNFRKLLLIKCQKEFEQDRSDELRSEEKLRAIEEAEPEKKKELQLEFNEGEKKLRYRQLGNIRFIGELFKLGMLTEPIMHDCIKRLMKQLDEESLECLCKLLKTIGKELDDKANKRDTSMEDYFNTMQNIVEKRMTSSRVRFMLQDVIDLKKNHWIPRRDENNPKTIDQIHKEAEREAREQQMQALNTPYTKRPPDDRDRRKSTGRNMGTTEDGWTSSTKSNKGSYSVVDPTKLKLTKPDEVDSIRLGPLMGRGPQSWGRGSSGGSKTTTEPDKTTLTNRFTALADASMMDGRRGSQKSAASSRESSRGRTGQMPPIVRNTSSTSKEREELLETVKGLARSSAPPETKAPEPKQVPDPQVNGKAASTTDMALKGSDISDNDMDSKTKPLIEEFLHNNNDFEEAIRCIMELVSPNTVHMFISAAINQILERSSQARYSVGQLLYFLVSRKIITLEQYKKGFHPVVEYIDDIALDVPLIWEYIGEILEPLLENSEVPLAFLKELLIPCIPSETAGLLVSAVLHCVGKKKGTIKLGEDWRDSSLQWTDFLGTNINVDNFIHKHKLEFTITPVKVKPRSQLPFSKIKSTLLELLQLFSENEQIFDWIDGNISENSHSQFIRALVSAVHENVITGNKSNQRYDLDQGKLKTRIPLLTRYIGKNPNSELQALYAIQALIYELNQPEKREEIIGSMNQSYECIYNTAILRNIFDMLYDDDVITEETFKKWEQSEDEVIGKSIALNSVSSFFTWLQEDEDSEE